MQIIQVKSKKGGIGKSLFSREFAQSLAALGLNVALFDASEQANDDILENQQRHFDYTIKECIIDSEKTRRIPEFIASGGSQYGMQTFDQSLYGLYQQKLITFEEALRWSSNPDDFTLKVKGIQTTSDIDWGTLQGKDSVKPVSSGKISTKETPKGSEIKIDRFGSS